jgi:hypothetical protein
MHTLEACECDGVPGPAIGGRIQRLNHRLARVARSQQHPLRLDAPHAAHVHDRPLMSLAWAVLVGQLCHALMARTQRAHCCGSDSSRAYFTGLRLHSTSTDRSCTMGTHIAL